jgi:hypothetical protein
MAHRHGTVKANDRLVPQLFWDCQKGLKLAAKHKKLAAE